jgi:hypothetical protein|tara:strand:- start:2199 stop:2375 length:177 start_codon:yes stop_codon:yes gene_type:complete
MEDVIDLIATDASASDISDKIKDALFNKASSNVENERSSVAHSIFNIEDETKSEEDSE